MTGHDEAAAGETFLKIGVGAAHKPLRGEDSKYDHFFPYEIANHGQ